MSSGEFDLINQYFRAIPKHRRDVGLGIGDDAALTSVPPGHHLVTTVDTLIESVHFATDIDPTDLAYKALAVNLSDLAAMGAEPAWITLSLTIPELDHAWLQTFSDSLAQQCRYFDVQLIGGDTCRGPLSITIQAMGFVPESQAIKRSGAQAGDLVYVTGTLGDAGAGLAISQQQTIADNIHSDYLLKRLHRPTPRLEAGLLLRQFASAAIDVSDGLLQDIKHILDASSVGAVIEMNNLPISPQLMASCSEKQARSYALTSGDDYELCFTIPRLHKDKCETIFTNSSTEITMIGHITAQSGLRVQNKTGFVEIENSGYDHFNSTVKV